MATTIGLMTLLAADVLIRVQTTREAYKIPVASHVRVRVFAVATAGVDGPGGSYDVRDVGRHDGSLLLGPVALRPHMHRLIRSGSRAGSSG